MKWSVTLGAIRGIKIKIHVTFLLIILWAAYSWGFALRQGWPGALYGIVVTVAIFACVVLHELAHSLVATFYGLQVTEIELSPIGGLAKLESMPQKAPQEFAMAVVGPLANLLIAVPLGVLTVILVRSGSIKSFGHLLYLMRKPSWQGLVLNLFSANVFLALFNLLPAFPMDGGRVLRSALSRSVGHREATRLAALVGQWLSGTMGLIGLFGGNLFLTLMAAFVFLSAQQEARMTEMQATLGNLRVAEALITSWQALSTEDTVDAAIRWAMHGQPAPFPVVEGTVLVGLVTTADATAALETYGPSARVGDIMRKQFPHLSVNDTLMRAQQLMASSGLRALPVAEDGRLLGMVSMQQIEQIYTLLSAQQEQAQALQL